MSEAQAFYILAILCDRLLPGYYSTTMYGTLLDQRVFESLVEKTMPILWDHLIKSDVQLSVVSLPWFLSLYINSMPLVFAFRVLDMFFLEGPKVLFQIGLAILRINGEELLDAADDGTFISVLKTYFATLDESAHPKSENQKLRAITKFQELLVVALQEFQGITQQLISEQRTKHKDAVLENIENFAKRTSIRNLGPDSKRLNSNDLGFLYDRFYGILYERQQRMQIRRQETDKHTKEGKLKANELVTGVASNDSVEMGRVGLGPSPTQMNYDAFREFLAGISRWAVADSVGSPHNMPHPDGFGTARSHDLEWGSNREPADHDFMQRLFGNWDVDQKGELSLQNVVTGMARMKGNKDIMATIAYFFDLYDDDGNGRVDREGILRISEGLLFLSRRGFGAPSPAPGGRGRKSTQSSSADVDSAPNGGDEQFLGGISAFIRRCFEYADPDSSLQQSHQPNTEPVELATNGLGAFSIGDDEEDLMDFGSSKDRDRSAKAGEPTSPKQKATTLDTIPKTDITSLANAALDPSKPVHITLPTFRMLILADETLEYFFDIALPHSFHLADATPAADHIASTGRTFSTSSGNLTTFSNLRAAPPSPVPTHPMAGSGQPAAVGPAGGVVPPGNRGLRGMLDNIVTDGMRVAAEVKRRMDEAQKDLERNAAGGPLRADEDEDEEGEDGPLDLGIEGGIPRDRDLLEGADAEAIQAPGGETKPDLMDSPVPKYEDVAGTLHS